MTTDPRILTPERLTGLSQTWGEELREYNLCDADIDKLFAHIAAQAEQIAALQADDDEVTARCAAQQAKIDDLELCLRGAEAVSQWGLPVWRIEHSAYIADQLAQPYQVGVYVNGPTWAPDLWQWGGNTQRDVFRTIGELLAKDEPCPK